MYAEIWFIRKKYVLWRDFLSWVNCNEMVTKSIVCSYHFSNPAADSLAYYFLEKQSNYNDCFMEKLWAHRNFVILLLKCGLSSLGILPRFPGNFSPLTILTLLYKCLFHVQYEFSFMLSNMKWNLFKEQEIITSGS